jgi:hypothetical protein
LDQIFNCNNIDLTDTKNISDFNKNFKLDIPISWNTALYYNSYQSEIFTADTTKQLTESFIFDVSFNLGELNFDDNFYKKTDSILTANNLQIVKSGNHRFQEMPAYWYLVKGSKRGFTFHQFNLMVKNTPNAYFKAYSEIYGDEHINERICESIGLLKNIEFLE